MEFQILDEGIWCFILERRRQVACPRNFAKIESGIGTVGFRRSDIPLLPELLVARLDEFHALRLKLFLAAPSPFGFPAHMPGAMVIKPRALRANELESRELSPKAIIDIAEIAEEAQIEHSDTFDKRPLDEDRITREHVILAVAEPVHLGAGAGEPLHVLVILRLARRHDLMIGMAVGEIRGAAHNAEVRGLA